MVFFYVIYTCVNFTYLYIFLFLLLMSSTAEPSGFSLTGALLGGAMVLVAHGWVAVMGGPVRFLAC